MTCTVTVRFGEVREALADTGKRVVAGQQSKPTHVGGAVRRRLGLILRNSTISTTDRYFHVGISVTRSVILRSSIYQ